MLGVAGVSDVDALYADVPEGARLGRPLEIEGGMSEVELAGHLRALADRDVPATRLVTFAGCGCYDHHAPSVVDHIVRRPEMFTAYTPYQPEVSQGTLQAIYEYQTMVCELTGMDVANASMYDGASAFAEAALMAARTTGRKRVLVAGTVPAEWSETLATYAAAGTVEPVAVGDPREGSARADSIAEALDDATAAVMVASPNRFGVLEDIERIAGLAHEKGALCVVGTAPVLLGVMRPPGESGADIVVAEGQALGGAMSFGGPGLGMFACRLEHVRTMPGRLVGRTVDVEGNPGYVLTFATREQHIRREKATSNICSNHSLNAIGAGAYLCAVGREGLAGIARACMAKARYLREALLATGAFTSPWEAPFGYEFTLRYGGGLASMHAAMLERGYIAGVPVRIDGEDAGGLVTFAVTEKRTRAEMDAFAKEVAAL